MQNIPTYAKASPEEPHTSDVIADASNKEFKDAQRQQKETTYSYNIHKQQVQEYMYSPDVVATRVHVELDLVTPVIHDANCDHPNVIPDENPIILCNIAVNSRCEVNQKTFSPYTEALQDKANSENVENVKAQTKSQRLQPEGVETLCVEDNFKCANKTEYNPSLATEQKSSDSLDGMLDKISHDLDYLLNRTGVAENDQDCNTSERTLHTHNF